MKGRKERFERLGKKEILEQRKRQREKSRNYKNHGYYFEDKSHWDTKVSVCKRIQNLGFKKAIIEDEVPNFTIPCKLEGSDKVYTYRADIICLWYGFIVEVDGESHRKNGRTKKDQFRDKIIYDQYGITTVRFPIEVVKPLSKKQTN